MSKEIKDLPSPAAPIDPHLVEMAPKTSKNIACMPFETLGAGGSGVIALGKMNGEKCAIKVFDFNISDEDEIKQLEIFQNSIRNMVNISSNRLAKPIADYYKEYTRLNEKTPRLAYFQIMPYIEGMNLGDYFNKKRDIPKEARKKIGLQTAQGLRDLHEHNVIHNDLRAVNIIIHHGNWDAVLCDFDFSLTESKQTHSFSDSERLLDFYSPPEHHAASKEEKAHIFTKATDIYKLGFILYQLYTNNFETEINEDLLSTDEFSNLIRRCVAYDPKDRPSADEVVKCLEKICESQSQLLQASEPKEEPKTSPTLETAHSEEKAIAEPLKEMKSEEDSKSSSSPIKSQSKSLTIVGLFSISAMRAERRFKRPGDIHMVKFTKTFAKAESMIKNPDQHSVLELKKVCHELKSHQDFCNKKINQYLKDSKKYPLAKYTNIIQNYRGAIKHAENLIHEIQKIMTEKHTPASKHFYQR